MGTSMFHRKHGDFGFHHGLRSLTAKQDCSSGTASTSAHDDQIRLPLFRHTQDGVRHIARFFEEWGDLHVMGFNRPHKLFKSGLLFAAKVFGRIVKTDCGFIKKHVQCVAFLKVCFA